MRFGATADLRPIFGHTLSFAEHLVEDIDNIQDYSGIVN